MLSEKKEYFHTLEALEKIRRFLNFEMTVNFIFLKL